MHKGRHGYLRSSRQSSTDCALHVAMTEMSKESHLERTSKEPRDEALHKTTISHIDEINPSVRIIRLAIPENDSITFLPGQWLDVYVPPFPNKAGGFTITSSPLTPHPDSSPTPYLELAIQRSPENPIAAYLWQYPASSLLETPVTVRVGGSFVWPPPPPVSLKTLRKAVFVAGGVGINPLISMFTFLAGCPKEEKDFEVRFFYSLRDPGPGREAGGMLFLDRVAEVFASGKVRGRFRLFLTGVGGEGGDGVLLWGSGSDLPFERRRVTVEDVAEAIGEDKGETVVYVCGVPSMTDHFVERLTAEDGLGMGREMVLFEKWW